MSADRKNSGGKAKSVTPTSASGKDKPLNRFVFACIGMILYIMPCLSCLGIGVVSEGGISPVFIFAFVLELLSIPVGLLGINSIKRPQLHTWCIISAAVLLALHIVCAVFLGVWYLIMAPTFILLALYIAWSSVVKK